MSDPVIISNSGWPICRRVCVCVCVCLSIPVFLDIGYGVSSTLHERRATLILRHVRDMGRCSHSSRPLVITMIAVIIITIIIIIIMKVSTISPLPWISPQTSSSDISIWHSEDRASWYILIMKANEMQYFTNLFDKVLYMFRTDLLSIIRSISTLYTRNTYLLC